MKIYPNKSSILITKEINNSTDIPLSYIDTSSYDYNINQIINEIYKIPSKTEILPYDTVDMNKLCLFDDKENIISKDRLVNEFTRINNKYYYIPKYSIKFNPKTFKYNVLVKKNLSYSSNTPYNLKVAISNNVELGRRFISICGDAPDRMFAPNNVLINNGDLSTECFSLQDLYKSDFILIEYEDSTLNKSIEYNFVTNKRINNTAKPIDLLKKYNSNLICVIDGNDIIKDFDSPTILSKDKVQLMLSKDEINYTTSYPQIFDSVSISTREYFTVPNDTDKKRYINLFNIKDKAPILIEEDINSGFVIYITKNIFEEINNNYKLIYEVMLYVYFNAYLRSQEYEEWITDTMPDYIVTNKKLIKKEKFLSSIELFKMFDMSKGDIILKDVYIDKTKYPFVKFNNIENDFLTFTKDTEGENKKYADLEKPKNSISIYTQNKNIIYFNEFIYSINDSIEDCMKIERQDNKLIINFKPFRHSSTGICIENVPEPLELPLYKIINNTKVQIDNEDYYLICKSNFTASKFELISKDKYKQNDGNILATIQIRKTTSKNLVYDMRHRGGGLPKSYKDNYNCFDIGHIFGLPYRKAGTLIITLPKYLEPNKELILDTIKQYCVAEDYPILVFKDGE